jgi:hypothetical protein
VSAKAIVEAAEAFDFDAALQALQTLRNTVV